MATDPIATAQRAIGAHDLPLSARLVLAWLALALGMTIEEMLKSEPAQDS